MTCPCNHTGATSHSSGASLELCPTHSPFRCDLCDSTGRVRECWSGGHSCDLAPAREGDRETFACPDCRKCDGACEQRFELDELHEIDGEFYCDFCSAALVTLSMQALGMLPTVRDTVPCGPCGAGEG